MENNWIYNIIKKYRESEAFYVNLDVILDRMGNGASFSLTETPPCAVTIEPTPQFYIKPVVEDLVQEKDPKIIIFSAPGATGKSALARFISNAKHALLWDLSKEKIASHSFSGMLLDSLGAKEISRFMEGLTTGQATLVVDALDEAELVSGRAAIEMLFIAQIPPACPGVGLLDDSGGGLGCVVRLGVGPGHPQSNGEGLDALTEDPPRRAHDAAEIVLFHGVDLLCFFGCRLSVLPPLLCVCRVWVTTGGVEIGSQTLHPYYMSICAIYQDGILHIFTQYILCIFSIYTIDILWYNGDNGKGAFF